MENATRALLIAAGVLIGMLILSLGIYLYTSLGRYVSAQQEQMEFNAINKFNTQFLKYNNIEIDENNHETELFKINIQDVITAANLAYENNQKYNLTFADVKNSIQTTLYVKVNLKVTDRIGAGSKTIDNLQEKINLNSSDSDRGAVELLTSELSSLPNDDIKVTYKCRSKDIKISQETGRVYEINFEKIIDKKDK